MTTRGKIIGFKSVFFVKKLKSQFTWNKQQKKVSFNNAASVNIKWFLSVLPHSDQVEEVRVLGTPQSTWTAWAWSPRLEGRDCRPSWASKVFLNHVLLNPRSLLSPGLGKGHTCRASTYPLCISGKWMNSWPSVVILICGGRKQGRGWTLTSTMREHLSFAPWM